MKRAKTNTPFGMPIVRLEDLDRALFRVSFKKQMIKLILSRLILKGKHLYKILKRAESQKNNAIGTIKSNFLTNWRSGIRVPLDVLFILLSCTYLAGLYLVVCFDVKTQPVVSFYLSDAVHL